MRLAFVVHGAMNRKDWRTVSSQNLDFSPADLARQLIPLLRGPLPGNQEPGKDGARLVEECRRAREVILPFTEAELREVAWAGNPRVSERGLIRRLESRFIILPITKNNTSRVVPINETLYRILAEMPQKSGYVFGNGNGGHVGDIKDSFTSTCRRAGIADFRFHDLRHIYASHLAMRGVHIRALQELLGHKTLAMTQRYSHLAPEQIQNAVKLLDGVIGERRELGGQAVA
jgi:hypothetical protein